jgi:hypothetical protein
MIVGSLLCWGFVGFLPRGSLFSVSHLILFLCYSKRSSSVDNTNVSKMIRIQSNTSLLPCIPQIPEQSASTVKHRPSDRCSELTTKHLVSTLQSFELGASLVELWSLLDTPVSEQKPFMETAISIAYKEEQMQTEGSLSLATLQEVRLPTDFAMKGGLLLECPLRRFYLKPITSNTQSS